MYCIWYDGKHKARARRNVRQSATTSSLKLKADYVVVVAVVCQRFNIYLSIFLNASADSF